MREYKQFVIELIDTEYQGYEDTKEYKVTVDNTGHVSGATAVAKADITALGIPGTDTNTTYGAATSAALGLIKAKFDSSSSTLTLSNS